MRFVALILALLCLVRFDVQAQVAQPPVKRPNILFLFSDDQRADTIHVTATFPLDLHDYQIGGLTKMLGMLRMDPHIEVHVDLRFVATTSVNP